MTTPIDWQKIIETISPKVLENFYHPMIPATTRLLDTAPEGKPTTAWFDFATNRRYICRQFLEELVLDGGIDPKTAVIGIEKHEIGHYVYYPRELATLLFLGHIGKKSFDKYAEPILAYWCDIRDNFPQIRHGKKGQEKKGKEVRALYRAVNTRTEKCGILSAKERAILDANGIDSAEVEKIHRTYSVDRLLTAYYQIQSKEDLGVDLSDSPFLVEQKAALLTLHLDNPEMEFRNYLLFGGIIIKVLKKLEEELPEKLKQQQQGCQQIMKMLMQPVLADAPGIKDFSESQIDEALDKIIKKWGKTRYEMIREYVEEERGRTYDSQHAQKKRPIAGFEHSALTFHDEDIEFYKRKAGTYGLYIHKKPIVTDVTSNYPEGSQVFRVGDPVHRMNKFSTGGLILPGITQRYREQKGTRKDKKFRVPDALILLDTSGSMLPPYVIDKHPNGSEAVLGANIIATNYHANGAHVGVANFSVETAFLAPTRDIHAVRRMLTAYWGGGTYSNIPKLKEYVERMARGGIPISYTTEQDYKELVNHMDHEQRKEFEEKNITVSLKKEVREQYEKMDNFLITDGGIANIEELVEYMNSIAAYARNTVFLLGNKKQAEDWRNFGMKNTQIISVEDARDLAGIVIGNVQRMAPSQQRHASLCYR